MYILYKPMAVLGSLIIAMSSIFCPFLKVPIIGNWNLYQTDVRLFMITYFLLAVAVLLFFVRKIKAYRVLTYVMAMWSIVALIGVYFTLNNYFGFKFVDNIISKTISFKWGWIVLFIGNAILIFSTRKIELKEPFETKEGMLA